MFPYIVFLGRPIATYHIMALIGLFSAGIYSCICSKVKNVDYIETMLFLLLAGIGVILGSHLFYIIVNYKYIGTKQPFTDIVRLFFSGSVFYGGLIGSIVITYFFRKKFMDFIKIIEIVTPSIPLFHFWGRIGCFLYGCCFGIENSSGFTFQSSPIEAVNGITRLPVQLIEAIYNLLLFILLHKLRNKKPFKDQLFLFYLLFYSTGRFIIEFFRGDAYRGIYFNLSVSQIISIIILIIVLLKRLRVFCYTRHE
jgi:phosphatidylglycerol:prolipoprotein diacylglycerol transferase